MKTEMGMKDQSTQSNPSNELQAAEHPRGTSTPKQDVYSGSNALPRHLWTWSVATEHHQHEVQALMIDHKSKEALLRREGERWVLPGLWVNCVDCYEIEQSSTTVEYVKELTGTANAIVFLRPLWRKERDVEIDDVPYTLEKHVMLFDTVSDPSLNKRGFEWVKLQDADVYHLFDEAARAVREAIMWASIGTQEPKSLPWQKPGWLESSTLWMEDVLERQCNAQLTQPVFMKRSSGSGVVLRAETDKGRFFLKCSPPLANEAAYTDALSNIVPQFVARPIVVDLEKQRMVMAEYGELVNVMRISTKERKGIMRDYARLQQSTVNRTYQLIEAGFPDMRPTKLLEYIDELPSDAAFLALADIEEYAPFVEFFCENTEGTKELLEELRASGIPATITHNDLHLTNMYKPVDSDHYMFFDWAEGFVSHPFASSPLGIRAEAFLEEWKGELNLGIEELRRLLAIGSCAYHLASIVLRLREANACDPCHANYVIELACMSLEDFKLGFCEINPR